MSETRTSEYLQKLENKVRELEAEKLEIAKSCISCRKEFRETLAKAQADVLKERELTAKMQLEFSKSLTPADARGIIEELAGLEHEQWMYWSKSVWEQVSNHSPSSLSMGNKMLEKHEKWIVNWVPYSELTEETKEFDRIWARKVIDLFAGKGVDLIKCPDCGRTVDDLERHLFPEGLKS